MLHNTNTEELNLNHILKEYMRNGYTLKYTFSTSKLNGGHKSDSRSRNDRIIYKSLNISAGKTTI